MKPARIFVFSLMLLVLGLGILSVYMFMSYGRVKQNESKLKAEFQGLEKTYLGFVDQMKLESEKNNAEKQSKKYDSYTLLSKCGVGMYIPNEKYRYDPYSAAGVIDGVNRAWRLHGEPVKKEGSNDLNPFIGGYRYYTILRNDNEASGYVAGFISVECVDNKDGLSLDAFTTKYLDSVKKENKQGENSETVKANTLTVKKEETMKKWGLDVNRVTIERMAIADSYPENGYIFTFGNTAYYIHSYGLSTDKKATKMMNNIIESIYLYK